MSENQEVQATEQATAKAMFHFRPLEVKGDTAAYPKADLKTIRGKQFYKRPSFEAVIPVVTEYDTIALLGDENKSGLVLKYLIKLANGEVNKKVSQQLRNAIKRGAELSQDILTLDKLDLYSLAKYANGVQVPKELWQEWKKDYIAVMQPILDRPIEKLATATEIFMGGLARVESQENYDERMKLLDTLEDYINKWFLATSPENQEKFGIVREYLDIRFEFYRAPDDEKELSLDDI